MKIIITTIAFFSSIFAVTLLSAIDSFAKKGGPDDFGYVFIDSNESPAFDPGGASLCNTAFTDISTTGTALNLTMNEETNVTAPFAITLYDTTSTDVRIGNNGGLVLDSTTNDIYGINYSLPTADRAFANGPGVVPFWDNLGDDSGNVYTKTTGSAPDRKFIIQWHNRPYYGSDGADTATFQVVFYEGISRIDFVYEDVFFSAAAHDYGASATIGINQDGSNALQYSFNESSLNTPSSVTAICFEKPTVSHTVTAGADRRINGDNSTGGYCPETETFTIRKGETVQICYEIENTSSFTDVSHHWLISSNHGDLLTNFPYSLQAGHTVFLNEWDDDVDTGYTETATWRTEAAEDTGSATVNVVDLSCPANKPLTTKYLYDFEADNGGGIGTNDWEWGEIPSVLYSPQHSEEKVWATILNGPYNDLNDHNLLTFELDLRGVRAPVGLFWRQTLQANGSGFDYATITANGDTVYDSSGLPDESVCKS